MSSHVFVPAMLAGGACLAVWAYVRFPRARPRSLTVTLGHVLVSFALFTFVPALVHAAVGPLPVPLSVVVAVAGITVPTLCYLLLSWVWLLAYLLHAGTSGPRGGHPVTATGR